ncbi:DMT family transporter [soil metagenome]
MVVVLALGCALSYGVSDFVGGLLARRISPWAVAVVGQAAATVLTLALALVVGGDPTASDWAWSALAGVGSGAGVAFLYRGLGAGSMSVVAPVSALLAALVPVAVGVVTGERPATLTWLGVACALPAIWLVSSVGEDHHAEPTGRRRRADLMDATLAGLGFGVLFASLGQVPDGAGFGPLTLTQSVGVATTIVLATALGAPWVPRGRTAVHAVWVGVLGMAATVLFLLATQTGLLTVAGVLASLYPASTVLLAAVVLHERIGRGQGVGLALAAVAVALVAAG